MGWRGALRSFAAAARAAERDAVRREKARYQQAVASHAANAVAQLEDHLESITSIHTTLAEAMDWHAIAAKPEPVLEPDPRKHFARASNELAKFKPSLAHMFKGGSEKMRAKLQKALSDAPTADQADREKQIRDHQEAVAEWRDDVAFANRILLGDTTAIRDVLQETKSLGAEGWVGAEIGFSIANGRIHATPHVHSDEIVPKIRRKQLASGRLSESKMPVGEFNERYQDYVASAALRVAGDLFQVLPMEEILVTCRASMLDPKTGHIEPTPILSVRFVRRTFMTLNLEAIDPSDSMRNFNHVMKFSRTKGFSPIEPLPF